MNPKTSHLLHLVGLALVLAGLTGGCVDSVQPLSARADARPDPRLTGTWWEDGVYVDRAAPRARVTFDAHGIGHAVETDETSGQTKKAPVQFFVTRAGQDDFINLLDTSKPARPGHPQLYTILKYRVADDLKSIRFYPLVPQTIEDAIRVGKLRGRIVPGEYPLADGVHLQDSPENMLRFIESASAKKVFEEKSWFTLSRVK